METATRRSANRVAGLLLVAAGCVLLVAIGWGRISAPFGDSDEGINGAVWALSASSLRTLGVSDSKLGGERRDGTEYATHPPGTVVTTALTQAVGGARPWASRAPAWLATLAALVLLYRLARRAGFDPLVAGGATALVAITPMALVYGPMLDTPIVAFPFGVLVITCWFRDWNADEPPDAGRAALTALAAALAGLFGWQAAVLTALCGLALAARALRHRPGALRTALPYMLGGAAGVALSLSWSWWVYGDLHTLFDKFGGRSGESSGVGIGDMVSFQLPWLANLLGLSFVGLIGCLVALRDRFLRPLAAMALASVAVYAVVFRQAAAGHQYWNYWVLLPTAIGWAYVLRAVVGEVARARAGDSARTTSIGVVIAIVVFVGAFGVLRPDRAQQYIDEGHRAARLVDDATFPADQVDLGYVGQPYRPDAWITYNTDLAPFPITSADQVRALAVEDPDHLVLILGACDEGDPSYEICTDITRAAAAESDGDVTRPRLVPAGQLLGSSG
jgi:hypothetical protein